ncbi:MAG: pyridoxal phosphate-dependent aminotransferase [Lachnospiraceae bacterium]|nr:pyridoxal phosphate-dependent aminotransferase [Lachnospiraceae bacterium]
MQKSSSKESEFDNVYNRSQTHDLKWRKAGVEAYLSQEVREDMIPMWIADMDFGCMQGIVEAVKKRAEHGIYGYCGVGTDFYEAIEFWNRTRYQWNIEAAWATALPSVVSGVNIAIRAFTESGDGVIVQTPVYDPFMQIISMTKRTVVINQLKRTEEHYEMDFEGLEELVKNPSNKMLILCSPHNPVGRVWKKEELTRLADLCIRNHVMIVTDEIHSDIVYGEHRHVPMLSLDESYAKQFIHLSSPGKTFNIPGLKMAYSLIPNPEMRKAFQEMQLAMSLDIRNTFGIEGISAAYSEEGAQWREELIHYLSDNVTAVEKFLSEHMPKIRMNTPEGTFLCWLDFSGYGMSDEELMKKINLGAGIVCIPGSWFGPGGEHFIRLNIGCPREMLMTALQRINDEMEG